MDNLVKSLEKCKWVDSIEGFIPDRSPLIGPMFFEFRRGLRVIGVLPKEWVEYLDLMKADFEVSIKTNDAGNISGFEVIERELFLC